MRRIRGGNSYIVLLYLNEEEDRSCPFHAWDTLVFVTV